MLPNINDYKKIVGDKVIKNLRQKAKKFQNKHIVCINSTHQGGGVAEMLNSMVILFNQLGIDFGWRILQGSTDFFNVTKGFHNSLQGGKMNFGTKQKITYEETNKRFSIFTHLNHDLVIIHDPQPLSLINYYKKKQPWIWRCHIDLSNPNPEIWKYLKKFIRQYDHAAVSAEQYKKTLKIPQSIIHPAIDPLTSKNRELPNEKMNKYLRNLGIDLRIPIISQISRYDKWKDPEGVVKVFEKVKKKANCQLVLLGNTASDDPEGTKIYNNIMEKYGHRHDIKILVNVPNNDFVVNSLQKKSAVVLQKSTKEGFGLTVSEALFKETPVVASNTGGIPLQIINGENGFLHEPKDYNAFSASIVKLLQDKKLRKKMGENGREYVKKNFLITRLLNDWLNIFELYL